MMMMIAGLPRVWEHPLRRDRFRGSMVFCLQGIGIVSYHHLYIVIMLLHITKISSCLLEGIHSLLSPKFHHDYITASSSYHHHISITSASCYHHVSIISPCYYHNQHHQHHHHHHHHHNPILLSRVMSQTEQAELCLRQVRAIPEELDRWHNVS